MPVTWITPKTDWLPTDRFTADDWNRIINNYTYIEEARGITPRVFVPKSDGDVLKADECNSLVSAVCFDIFSKSSWNRGFVARRTPYGSAWNHDDLNAIETLLSDFKRYIDGELDNKATIYAGGEIYCGDNISVGLL